MCNQGMVLSAGVAMALRIGVVIAVVGLIGYWAYLWLYCRPREIGPWKH